MPPDSPESMAGQSLVLPSVEGLQAALPQFQILEMMGREGIGIRYRALEPELEREVTIRVMMPGKVTDALLVRRFKKQAQAMASLQHPGIVSVYELGEAKIHERGVVVGLPYVVMEFVAGASLSEVMDAGGVSRDDALAITAQICRAVHHAEQRGVLHRDIDPEYVLLGEDGTARVTGFDLAEALKATVEDVPSSRVRPAESLGECGASDPRSDIKSLGALLDRMLTGKRPEGDTGTPSRVDSAVDPQLNAVVRRATETDGSEPYSEVKEMLTDLESLVLASKRGRAGKEGRRWAWVSGVLIILAVLALVTTAVWRTYDQQARAAEKERIEAASARLKAAIIDAVGGEDWEAAAGLGWTLVELEPMAPHFYVQLSGFLALLSDEEGLRQLGERYCDVFDGRAPEDEVIVQRMFRVLFVRPGVFDVSELPFPYDKVVTSPPRFPVGQHSPWRWAMRTLVAYRAGDDALALAYAGLDAGKEAIRPDARVVALSAASMAAHRLQRVEEAREFLEEARTLMEVVTAELQAAPVKFSTHLATTVIFQEAETIVETSP